MRVAWLLLLTAPLWAQSPELAAYRAARRALADRPRGVIFNNDGCDVLHYPAQQPVSPAGLLDLRTTALAGSQVGAIAYCSISSGFGFFTHQTQAGTLLTRQPAEYRLATDVKNIAADLLAQGSDCLRIMVDFAHANRQELWWSLRMNDTHDVEHHPDRPYLLYPPLKEQHPEWLVGEVAKSTKVGRWSSVDYGRPEVRELAFRYLDEVARGYEVDGLELDFFRHLCYFRSVAHGGVASDAERDALTDLLRRVRTMTEQVGLARGRPLLLSIRVPDSVPYCRDHGLDLETWLREGLLDLLVTTCYFQLNPWEYSVELGRRYGVPVYPCLSDSRVLHESRFRRNSVESYRGRASNAWTAGAAGIHVFNQFNPRSPIWRELGSPATLRGKDKLYFVTVRDGNPNSWLVGGSRHSSLPVLTPDTPRTLQRQRPVDLDLRVGEDFSGAPAPQVTLCLELPTIRQANEVAATWNGQPLSEGKLAKSWLDLPLTPAQIRRGVNQLGLRAVGDEPGEAWPVAWQGPALPTGRWTRDRGSERCVAQPQEDGLLLADRGNVNGDYLYYRYPCGLDPDQETSIEVRVRVVSGLSSVLISNGRYHERLLLRPDGISLHSNSARRWALDTTAWHTYRVGIGGRDVRVWVDDVLRIDAPGAYGEANTDRQEVCIGAANSGDLGEAVWQSCRARPVLPTLHDAVVRVSYPQPAAAGIAAPAPK
ncbi:MAG: hypothetical protein IT204_13465 [Fimbriimonadaceae bacterium]|nr:hypothetical protein [Fimbriimonadaceae bacterium]